jgi:hypothetical protein
MDSKACMAKAAKGGVLHGKKNHMTTLPDFLRVDMVIIWLL